MAVLLVVSVSRAVRRTAPSCRLLHERELPPIRQVRTGKYPNLAPASRVAAPGCTGQSGPVPAVAGDPLRRALRHAGSADTFIELGGPDVVACPRAPAFAAVVVLVDRCRALLGVLAQRAPVPSRAAESPVLDPVRRRDGAGLPRRRRDGRPGDLGAPTRPFPSPWSSATTRLGLRDLRPRRQPRAAHRPDSLSGATSTSGRASPSTGSPTTSSAWSSTGRPLLHRRPGTRLLVPDHRGQRPRSAPNGEGFCLYQSPTSHKVYGISDHHPGSASTSSS